MSVSERQGWQIVPQRLIFNYESRQQLCKSGTTSEGILGLQGIKKEGTAVEKREKQREKL